MRDRVVVPAPLLAHWSAWTGATPEQLSMLGAGLTSGGPQVGVVSDIGRTVPGWDGSVSRVTGVVDADDNAVLSLPLGHTGWAQDMLDAGGSLDDVRAAIPARFGEPDSIVYRGICRWAVDVPAEDVLPDVGIWIPADDESVPEWLQPFGGDVLVVLDDGVYVAGVGFKVHDEHGQEISVGTTEAARGRGLARALVAQAARALFAKGIVATYLHAPDNYASAKVADAAGFPDTGWTALGLFDPR